MKNNKSTWYFIICCLCIMGMNFKMSHTRHELNDKIDSIKCEVDSIKSYYNGMVFVNGQWIDEDDASQM